VLMTLSQSQSVDLSLSAGAFIGPAGVIRLQVESIVRTRFRFAFFILLTGASLAVLSGCHRPPSADVVATVNGKDLMRAELDRNYKAFLGDTPQKLSPEEADIRRLTILHQMIEDEILQQRAAKLNLAASDEDVNAKITEVKAPYTQEEFDNQLKQRDLTMDDLKRNIRRSLTKDKLINKEIESRINITDAEISAYYTAHKTEFNLIEPQYHLAQIVVTSAPAQQAGNLQNNKASGDADAKKKIQILHNRLESGEEFGAVAMNFSEDPNTASNGGDMGFVAESALKSDPQVYDALNNLKPGQFTDVLPLYDSPGPAHKAIGYAIYRLISRDPAGQRELNDPRVQQAIHTSLHNNRVQLLENAYFEKLQNEAKIQNYLAEQILKQGAQ
jgi:peptidyl-prolyl cis-trans isomerase SurA